MRRVKGRLRPCEARPRPRETLHHDLHIGGGGVPRGRGGGRGAAGHEGVANILRGEGVVVETLVVAAPRLAPRRPGVRVVDVAEVEELEVSFEGDGPPVLHAGGGGVEGAELHAGPEGEAGVKVGAARDGEAAEAEGDHDQGPHVSCLQPHTGDWTRDQWPLLMT